MRIAIHARCELRMWRGMLGARDVDMNLDSSAPTGTDSDMLGAVEQFEHEMMLERQREGIAKAKNEGRYKGRARPPAARLTKSSGLRLTD